MGKKVKKNFIILFLFLVLVQVYADTDKLVITLWSELEPFVPFSEEQNQIIREEAIERVLEEARVIFSAMIYGYSFSYTPYDKMRKIEESFILEPLAEIKWGDPYLKVTASEVREMRLYVTVHYRCLDYQTSRLEAWKTLGIPSASGRGSGDLFKGYEEKLTSLKNAIKEAIRNYMRQRTFNKPREIRGDIVLVDTPSTIIHAGEYITTTKVKLNIKDVIPYKIF